MTYVDGFVLPVPKKKLDDYKKLARKAARIWKEHGALEYREAAGDDLQCEGGPLPFPKLAGAKKDETVIFSWITYRSKAHRDQVNKKVMADKRLAAMVSDPKKMPFDCSRMAYGGFKVIVSS